jgi:hypothetical protein
MGIKVANNAFGTLASSITNSATSITLTTGQGARFPTLSAGDYFYATLIDTSNNLEIVKCTARSTDVLTVTRAQENTTARAYSAGDRIEIRITAATFEEASAIEDGEVTEAKLANGAVTEAKLGSGAVTEAKLGSGAVTEAKLGSGAVTAAKMASGAAVSNIGYTPQRGVSFNCAVRHNTWSRVFRMSVGPLYASAIVSISHTRNSVVHGSTMVVSGGHSSGGRIAQIEGHYYSGNRVGIEGDGGNDWWFCIYDNAYNDGSSNEYTFSITVIPLIGSLTNTYSSYTASSGSMRVELGLGTSVYTNNGTSDARYKSNLEPITNALEIIKALNGFKFDLNGERETGLLAQDVLPVFPELVTGLPKADVPEDIRNEIIQNERYILGLKYDKMAGLFVEGIKEQQAQIETLKAEIAALKAGA